MAPRSTLMVKLHVNGKKAGFAYGACNSGRFASSRVEIKRELGSGKCKKLYSYYLRCLTQLDSVVEFTALMYSNSQGRICSCLTGALARTFDDAEVRCYDGFLQNGSDREPIIIHDMKDFCKEEIDDHPAITIKVWPNHGRVLLRPQTREPFRVDDGYVYTAYFSYITVSPQACRVGACDLITHDSHRHNYIHSRILRNFTNTGEVFSTAEIMNLHHWPVQSDLMYGYKLLKYHFGRVHRSRAINRAATLSQVTNVEQAREGSFVIQLSGSFSQDMQRLLEKALLKGFQGKTQTPAILATRGQIIVTFNLHSLA